MQFRLLAPSSVVLSLLLSSTALAHKGRATRTIYLEAHEKLHVLVHLKMSGEPQRKALFVLADADRNGKISAKERAKLEQHLSARALGGVRLFINGKPKQMSEMKAKLKLPEQGAPKKVAIELMLHGAVDIPAKATKIAISTEVAAEPLGMAVVTTQRAISKANRGRTKGGGLKTVLSAGDRVEFELVAAGLRH